MAGPNITLPKASGKPTGTAPENPFLCNTRKSPANGPKDITTTLFKYLPLDKEYVTTWTGQNFYRMTIHNQKLESGKEFQAYDGKRLVIEVGCNTIIYLNINPNNPAHHRFFIQSTEDFFTDVTARVVSADVVKRTAPMVTVAKYETYFLMGLFSTVSIPMWLAITGADATYTVSINIVKVEAFRKLSKDLIAELENIQRYAPTLHKKIVEFLSNEKYSNSVHAVKQLPKKVATDEKAQAQLAGILYGKYALAPNKLTVRAAFVAVLVQIAVKSATNIPDAYNAAVNQRYSSLIRDLQNVDWDDPDEMRSANQKLVTLFQESGVQINATETLSIIVEVKSHPEELQQSLKNINSAFTDFLTKIR